MLHRIKKLESITSPKDINFDVSIVDEFDLEEVAKLRKEGTKVILVDIDEEGGGVV